ncbi:MAG: ABC transporter permease [Spirochaetaceae bacterium]|nr:ABC transporter permease [Spirochaetaceae bacterium]
MVKILALRYAFSNQNRHRRSSIRIATGIIFCVFALNVVISFMVGLQDQRFKTIREYQSYDAIIDVNNDNIDQLFEKLVHNDFKVYKFSEVPAIVSTKSSVPIFATIRAFDSQNASNLPYESVSGQLFDKGVTISYKNAVSSYLHVNQEINLVILKRGNTVPVVSMSVDSTISGIYSTPVADFNSTYFFMDRAQLLKYAPNTETKLAVYGDVNNLKSIVGNLGNVNTWKDQNQSLFAAMKLEQALMYLTLSLMSIIVLVHLGSSSKNLLDLKRKEIAILRVMGLGKKDIMNVFIIQALIIVSVGVLIGSALSLVFLLNGANMINILNTLTNHSVAVFSIPLALNFSIMSVFAIAIPIIIITYIISYSGAKSLLKNDGMEILINE